MIPSCKRYCPEHYLQQVDDDSGKVNVADNQNVKVPEETQLAKVGSSFSIRLTGFL